MLVIGPTKFISLLLSQRKLVKKDENWLHLYKDHILSYMTNIVSRGSKYIYREKMSLKHFNIMLKKFKFSDAEIRRITVIKKKFLKIFEDNIKEIFYVNPKTPAGFKNPKGPCLESENKIMIGGSSTVKNRAGMRAVIFKDQFEQEMLKVASFFSYNK